MATLTINTTDGTGWVGDPVAGMNAVWAQAATDLQAALVPSVNDVTITITRQFTGSGVGGSTIDADITGYSQIQAAYLALTPSNSIQTANWTLANIPNTPPTSQLNTFMSGPRSLSMSIGRISGPATTGTITLGATQPWDTSSLRGASVSGSGFTAYGVIMHEMTECLGRTALADKGSSTRPMDNFVFSAAGTHCTTQATTRYISVGGGGTTPALYFMDTNASDDAGDSLSGSPAFNGSTGQQAIVSRSSSLPLLAEDWQWLTLLGWNLSAQGLIWAGLSSAATYGFSIGLKR